MMKKIAALLGTGAMLLVVAGPALAVGWSMTINKANVTNTTTAVASTGISAGHVVTVEKAGVDEIELGGRNEVEKASTGDASALAVGVVAANTQIGCSGCGLGGFTVNKARVENVTGAQAVTDIQAGSGVSVFKAHADDVEINGGNEVERVHTGNARSLGVGVVLINTSWVH